MAKKTSNKELYEKAYGVALTKEAKRLGVVKKKRLTIALTAIAVVAAAGAGYAGYSIYKNINDSKLENRLVVDPEVSKDVQMSELKYDTEGNASCHVAVKNQKEKMIDGFAVTIGNDLLVEGTDYKTKRYVPNSDNATAYDVTIFKSALNAHSGKITIKPKVQDVTFTITFEPGSGYVFANAPADQTIKKNGLATQPVAEATTGESATGWYYLDDNLNEVDFIFTNPITRDYTLYPRWEMTKSFEIKLYCENQTFIQNVRKGQKISKPQVSKEGYHLDTGDDPNGSGWYEGDEGTGGQWNFDTALDETHIPSEAKLTAKWAINKYTVTFDSNGGTGGILTRPNIEHGSTISAPTGAELPTKTGYTLEGWYLNGNKFSFNGEADPTPVKSDITLVAKWKEDYVTVSFKDSDDEGTEIAAPQKVLRAGTLTEPDYTAKEGYTLEGWYTEKNGGGTKWVFGTQGTQVEPSTTEKTKSLYANWTINKYTVTFDSNGGDTGVTTQTDVPYNSTISAPTTPSKEGYTLSGWYLGDEKFKFVGEENATPVTSDITLVARWNEDPVTVSFMETDGTTEVATAQKVLRGGTLSEPKAVKTGYTIEGWYENDQLTGNKWVFGDSGTKVETTSTLSTKTLYAKWTANKYTVTFDSNGGSEVSAITNVEYDTKISAPSVPTKTGYTFAGWTHNGTAWDFDNDTVKENITLVASWTEDTYTVTFNSNGGSNVPSQTVKKGDKLVEPTATKEGHTLEGWYSDSGLTTKVDFSTYTVQGTATLYANWTPNKYKVTFDSNGGSSVSAITDVEYDTKISAPTAPTKTGYTFVAWTHNGTAWNFTSDTVKENITLVATWTEDTYTVTFNSNGGSTVPSQTVKKGDKLVEPTATKEGHTLEGWYSDSGLSTKVNFSTYTVQGTATLYAKWTANKYTVTFDSNGGSSVSAITNVEYNTTISAPTAPTKTGYTFAGWTHNGTAWNFSSDKVTENITLVATWTENVPDTIDINCGTNNEIATTAATATTTATLKKDGQEITCLGTKFYEISAKSIAAGDVTIDFSTGAVTITGTPVAGETFTIKVTYVYGATTVTNTQVVTFIAA